jgi:predicted nucleic acid-binding Zn ribbon protein
MAKKIYPRHCLNCTKEFQPKRNTQTVCCIPCSIEYEKKRNKELFEKRLEILRSGDKKQIKAFKQAENERFKIMKENSLSYAQKVNKVKKIFQAWIRKRDFGLNCICCNKPIPDNEHNASHYKKAELYSGVIFDEINVNDGCVSCNKWKDGNLDNYRTGLVNKYGEQIVKNLEQRANETRQKRWLDEDLKEIETKYKKLLK